MKKTIIKLALLTIVASIIFGGIWYEVKIKAAEKGEKFFTLSEVMAAGSGNSSYEEMCGSPFPSKSSNKLPDYRFDILHGLGRATPIYMQGQSFYANLIDINGDGLQDFFYSWIYYSSGQADSYCVSLLRNKGENFVLDYNCTLGYVYEPGTNKFLGKYYYGKCLDPNSIVP